MEKLLNANDHPTVSTTNSKPKQLLSQSTLPQHGWKGEAVQDIKARLESDAGFPCVFSKNAFKKGLILFHFVESACPADIALLAKALREYVEISKNWDGTLATSYPLIVTFSNRAFSADTLEDHQRFGWEILQKLHENDFSTWPEDIAQSPEQQTWSMCFAGMPIFCNMSSPHHKIRRSRNLGRHFKMVINPRERFDVFAGETPAGRKARANVRNRVEKYDGMSHAPQLASYQAGGLEWQQYGLPDTNQRTTSECPFKTNSEKFDT